VSSAVDTELLESCLRVARDERFALETEVRTLRHLVAQYKNLLDELLAERDILKNQIEILSSM
jgi:hypothetical protein